MKSTRIEDNEWVRDCPACGETSSVIYRCEHCGADLTNRGVAQ